MAISASTIVNITSRVISAGGNDLVFNGLVLTKSPLIPMSSIVMSFASPESVMNYFGDSSDEYKIAAKYFVGYDNSLAKPKSILFASRVDADRAAWLRSAPYKGTLQALKAITDGGMSISIDSTSYTIESVSFADAVTMSDIATSLQTALAAKLAGVTVTYSSINNSFTISSPTTGADSAISFAAATGSGTDLSAILSFTANSGAIISQGAAMMTIPKNMTAITETTKNWFSFTTMWEAESDEALEYDAWIATQGATEYLYSCWTTNVAEMVQGSTATLSYVFDQSASNSVLTYGNVDYGVFVLACFASIDWNRPGALINFAFKSQSGLVPTVQTTQDAEVLLSKKVNFYGNYATRNSEFIWYYNGAMFSQYNFLDAYGANCWLTNAIQVTLMNMFQNIPRLTYSTPDYTTIYAVLQDPVKRGVTNGCITAGISLSETQKAEFIRECGVSDALDNLYNDGYYIQVLDPGAQARVERNSPLVSLWYTSGGSINKIDMPATVFL